MKIVRDLRLMADRDDMTVTEASTLLRAAAMIEGAQVWGDQVMSADDHAASAALMSAQHSIGGLDE